MNFETIPAKSMDEYVGRDDCMIIYLREPEEYRKSHIRGAVNIPYDEMERSVPVKRNLIYILYCERGASSLMAARHMARQGYQVKTAVGGILAYRGRYLERQEITEN